MRILFFPVFLDARASLLARKIYVAEFSVIGEFGSVEVQAVRYFICVAFLFQGFNKRYLLDYIVRGSGKFYFFTLDSERVEVAEPPLRYLLSYILSAPALPARALLYFVLALIRVRHKVPDVRYVYDLLYLVFPFLESAAQRVRKHVWAQVAYVLAVVNGGPAIVHPHYGVKRFKSFYLGG